MRNSSLRQLCKNLPRFPKLSEDVLFLGLRSPARVLGRDIRELSDPPYEILGRSLFSYGSIADTHINRVCCGHGKIVLHWTLRPVGKGLQRKPATALDAH